MSRRALAVIVLALLIALPLAVWGALRATGHHLLPVDVAVERIELKSPAPAAEPGGGLLSEIVGKVGELVTTLAGERELTVTLRVHNGSPLPVSLYGARYALSVGPREILTGNWRPETAAERCAAGADCPLAIVLRPAPGNALDMVWEKLRDRSAPVRLHGEVEARVLGLPITRPFVVEHLDVDLLGTPKLGVPAAPETEKPDRDAADDPTDTPKARV